MTTRLRVQFPSTHFYIWIEFYLQVQEKVENTGLPALLFTFFEGCFFLMSFSVASCCKAGSSSSSAINSGMASQHARRKFAPLTHISIAKLQSLANYCGVTGIKLFVTWQPCRNTGQYITKYFTHVHVGGKVSKYPESSSIHNPIPIKPPLAVCTASPQPTSAAPYLGINLH